MTEVSKEVNGGRKRIGGRVRENTKRKKVELCREKKRRGHCWGLGERTQTKQKKKKGKGGGEKGGPRR